MENYKTIEYLNIQLWELKEIYFDNEGDPEIVNFVHAEMHKKWKMFLRNNLKISTIINLMSPEDILDNIEKLKRSGAIIDVTELAKKSSAPIISEKWDIFIDEGADEKELFERVAKDQEYKIEFGEIKMWLERKVPGDLLYEATRDSIFYESKSSDDFYEIIKGLIENGLKNNEIIWNDLRHKDIEQLAKKKIIRSIMTDAEKWIELGFNPKNYIRKFIHEFLYEIRTNGPEQALPSSITMKEFLDNISMQDFKSDAFALLAYDYKESEGNVTEIAQKLLDEVGYDESYNVEFFKLLDLGENEVLDPEKVACLCVDDPEFPQKESRKRFLTRINKKQALTVFRQLGVDKEILKNL